MHAIGNQVIARFPRKRVVYATCEKFTNEFITSHPAGQDRRVPGALPADRPPAHRRHPVHRGQGADPGGVLPHVQRDPRGRQADRPVVRPAAEGDPDPRGAAPQPLRVGPHRRPHGAGPRDAHRDPPGQGRGRRGPDHVGRRRVHRPQGRVEHPRARGGAQPDRRLRSMGATPISIELAQAVLSNVLYNPKKRQVTPERIARAVVRLLQRPDGGPPGPEARQGDRHAAPDRDVPDARGDRRLASAHRRRARRPRPLDGPPRLRQDHPRDRRTTTSCGARSRPCAS